MRPVDKKRFALAMASMGAVFQKKPDETLMEIYWRILGDMPIEAFESACSMILNTRTITGTFPLVAEIRAAAKPPETDIDTRIAVAWDKLLYAVQRHGTYDSVIFDDPVIHQIIKSWGGWIKWTSEITDAELKWARKDFAALYKSYASLNLPDPEPLEGLLALDNRNRGFLDDIPAPVLICGQTGEFKSLPCAEKKQIEDHHQRRIGHE